MSPGQVGLVIVGGLENTITVKLERSGDGLTVPLAAVAPILERQPYQTVTLEFRMPPFGMYVLQREDGLYVPEPELVAHRALPGGAR